MSSTAKDPECKLNGEEGNSGVFIYVLHSDFGQDEMMKTCFLLYVVIGAGKYSQVYQMFQSLSTGKTKCIRNEGLANTQEEDPIISRNRSYIPKLLPTNNGSPECVATAKEWLASCELAHRDCHRVDESHFQLPTRVLDVGSGDDVYPSVYERRGRLVVGQP